MISFRFTLILMLWTTLSLAQSVPATHVYSTFTQNFAFFSGVTNEGGYQFLAGTLVSHGGPVIAPGLLVQLNHEGEIIYIDTLREYSYDLLHRVDSFIFLSGFHYNKFPDTASTYIFEICDLHGKVIQSFSHDFIINIPFGAGMAQINDSIYIFSQACQLSNSEPSVVFYKVNTHSLNVIKTPAFKGGILARIPRIDDKPTFLEWSYALWIKDTTFVHTSKIITDTTQASQLGTILPREDKPGWFGFGGCTTPSNFYGICMIALNDKLELDKVDLLFHPPSGDNWYIGATFQSICKSEDAYYAAGLWNDSDPALFFWDRTLPTQIVVSKYDLELNRLWIKIVGGDRRYLPFDVHPRAQGGFMIAGGLKDNLDGNKHKPFSMFFDADGELVGQEEQETGRYEFTIYGNPGHEALRIMGRWPGRQVRLTVVNAMGSPMLSSFLTEGMNQFDTAWWPSGTYLLSITDESGRVLWSQPWIRQ
ncbi:MAG: T9SS type A sorting domain-containing protein [Saprospiraceae bacterium]|nr:T9SS type A sorting domain-containing protein [Saprospiraceae bacterium]